MTNQNALMSKLIQLYDELKESTFVTEDELFGQVIAKSIAKIPDGEIKEELKISVVVQKLHHKFTYSNRLTRKRTFTCLKIRICFHDIIFK